MAHPDYEQSVFINCPFDRPYRRLFDAIVFTVFDCGFIPRSALELRGTSEVRVEKIARLIEECRLGIHDLSRTSLDSVHRLPRFNMPFELGLFMGMARGVDGRQCLVLDRERYRYQKFLSDISGQDISPHDNEPRTAVREVRHWLRSLQPGVKLPGPDHIWRRYGEFRKALPKICRDVQLKPSELIFTDYAGVANDWIAENADF